MTRKATELLAEALKLDTAGRAELASELIASLDGNPDDDSDVAWASEIELRATHARTGADPGASWTEIREQLGRELRKR